jgi:hypothetical protein
VTIFYRIAVGTDKGDVLQVDQEFSFGSKEFIIERMITREEYLSGACFGQALCITSSTVQSNSAAKQFVPLRPTLLNAVEKKSVQLQPVNLYTESPVEKDQTKLKTRESHWTVNW